MDYFNERGLPSNPDLWTEKEVEKALWDIYKEHSKVARAMIALRRVPEWSNWFKGKIGAVTKRINPVIRTIFFRDYLTIKRLYKEGLISEDEYLTLWLHLTSGAREGWEAEGVKYSTKLEDCISSLCGLRWENLDPRLKIIKIYESKTNKWWDCDLTWLDPEPIELLMKYYREKGSIIKDITKCETVWEFAKYYSRLCEKISKLLNLPFKLKPHDIRRSHLSILAELGVPLEIAVSGHMSFGVGWEDLKTAYIFYLRFSKHLKSKIMEEIRQRQLEIAKSVTT
jgi:Phage integrase family.